MQIAEEFNDREQLLKVENIELKQDKDQAQSKHRKENALVAQKK